MESTPLDWVLSIIVGIMICLGIYAMVTTPEPAQAQTKPFNVYETDGACVYVAGYGATATIAVMPRYYARPGPC